MTLEQQRYLEEWRKKYNAEQIDVITMAFDYGLAMNEVRKIVQLKFTAEQMKQILLAIMEGIGEPVIDFLCGGNYNSYQIKEIAEGIQHGLTLEQVKTYAVEETSANQMKKMRQQLEHTINEGKSQPEDEGLKTYTQELFKIMEESLKQFRESNHRFEVLAELVKGHVLDEKNQEIKDLYENIQNKDTVITELNHKINKLSKEVREYQKQITDCELQSARKSETVCSKEKTAEGIKRENSSVQPQSKPKFLESLFNLKHKENHRTVFEMIMETELEPVQLEEIRIAVESGLPDEMLINLVKTELSAEKMKKMREIMVLIVKRVKGEVN